MQKRRITHILLAILLVLNLILAGVIYSSQNQKLKIVFFDVGQGDAILIEKGLNQILIDGGPSGKIELEKLGKYVPFWDRKIELIITTHPDQDHIEGLIDVIKNYKIEKIIDNGMSSDSQIYKNYLEIIKEKDIERLRGRKGLNIKDGEINLEIIYPDIDAEDNAKDTNQNSLVSKLTYGKSSFLFTGDFPLEKEANILESKVDLSAKFLKISHHGSKNATGEEFLGKVNPIEAIISVGKNNKYGHPASEIIDKLKIRNIEIIRTDYLGDIEYNCKSMEDLCELSK